MRLEGTYTFPGASKRVYAILTNPDALARAIPGCERFIQLGPETADGQTVYEARLRPGQRRQPYTITARVAASRQPDYLRLELHGHGPSSAISGDGSLDLVEQDNHTVVAYRMTLSGADLTESADAASREGNLMAQATCAYLAEEIYGLSSRESIQLPEAAESGYLDGHDEPALFDTPTWVDRAVWLGAGLALGLSAIALTLAIARRLGGREASAD
jgi:carbon monoxide dehydrogenase subunit G